MTLSSSVRKKASRFQRWVSENPELLEEFHGRALADGFNPIAGYADTNASTYSFYHPVDPRNNELTRTSQHPATIRHSYITILDSDDDDDNATTPVSTPQATRGNFFKNVDMPDAIKNMSGLLVPQRSDFAGTCVGNAELAQILAETLESVLNANRSSHWIEPPGASQDHHQPSPHRAGHNSTPPTSCAPRCRYEVQEEKRRLGASRKSAETNKEESRTVDDPVK